MLPLREGLYEPVDCGDVVTPPLADGSTLTVKDGDGLTLTLPLLLMEIDADKVTYAVPDALSRDDILALDEGETLKLDVELS